MQTTSCPRVAVSSCFPVFNFRHENEKSVTEKANICDQDMIMQVAPMATDQTFEILFIFFVIFLFIVGLTRV